MVLSLRTTLADTIARALSLVTPEGRVLLGITGAPGAGKSTVAQMIVDAIGEGAAIVGMDGYHLASRELAVQGSTSRKGAPDTFDVGGYLSILRRLKDRTEEVVYVPEYDRMLEESIGSASPVGQAVSLIVTEGNYLLSSDGQWGTVSQTLDQVWFLDVDRETRIKRLVQRHIDFGDTPENALRRALGSDERNAELVAATAGSADLVLRLE